MIADRTIAHVYRELPSYATVPHSVLPAAAARNLDVTLRALRSGRTPAPEELPGTTVTVTERVQHHVPVEDIMRAFRINLGVVEELFVEIARRDRVPPDIVLEGSRLLWSVGDALMAKIATVYQDLRIEGAVQDMQQRSAFVHALVTGALGPTELASQAVHFGLDPTASYFAVRGRSHSKGRLEELRRQLEQRGAAPDRACVVGIVAGDFAGVVARRPGDAAELVVGIGPALPLPDAAKSFHTASRVLDASWRLGKSGVLALEDLSWRLAATTDTEVSSYLTERYLTPLREHGEFGKLLEDTVRAYLANGLSPAATASQLVVHVNTLRHRLHKFTELTGASLTSIDVIVELAWAIEVGPPAASEPNVSGRQTG